MKTGIKKNISYKIILLVLVVFMLALFAGSYFLYLDVKNKNENISTLSQDLDSAMKRNEYLLSLQRTFQTTDLEITRVNSSVIPKDGDVQFIEDLESTARQDGLSITINSLTFEDNPSVLAGNMTNFEVKANANGSWNATYKFLAQLEAMPFKVRVNSFGLSSSVSDSGTKSKSTTAWQSVFEITILKYK